MMKTLLLSAAFAVHAAPALAQQGTTPATPASPADAFSQADTDKSGSLSIAELKVADATATQADFDKADSDKNKSLSKAEYERWAMSREGGKASAPGQ
jgi:hypothetical protein